KLTVFVNPNLKPAEVTPEFTVVSLDIETGGNTLYSIAVYLRRKDYEIKKVFMLSDKEEQLNEYTQTYTSEKDLLINFIKWFNDADPDIIIGWYIIGFDLRFLDNKCNELFIPFDIGRGGGRSEEHTSELQSRENLVCRLL